jgi:hypothetical protein
MFGLVSCYVSDFKQKFAVAAIIKNTECYYTFCDWHWRWSTTAVSGKGNRTADTIQRRVDVPHLLPRKFEEIISTAVHFRTQSVGTLPGVWGKENMLHEAGLYWSDKVGVPMVNYISRHDEIWGNGVHFRQPISPGTAVNLATRQKAGRAPKAVWKLLVKIKISCPFRDTMPNSSAGQPLA